jgi:hypothetical protein
MQACISVHTYSCVVQSTDTALYFSLYLHLTAHPIPVPVCQHFPHLPTWFTHTWTCVAQFTYLFHKLYAELPEHQQITLSRFWSRTSHSGAWGRVVVKALRYSSDGPGIDSRWCHWIFQWHIPSERTMALGSTQPLVKMSNRKIFCA